MKKPLMLMIMDGFGFAPAEGNAIKAANTPNPVSYTHLSFTR